MERHLAAQGTPIASPTHTIQQTIKTEPEDTYGDSGTPVASTALHRVSHHRPDYASCRKTVNTVLRTTGFNSSVVGTHLDDRSVAIYQQLETLILENKKKAAEGKQEEVEELIQQESPETLEALGRYAMEIEAKQADPRLAACLDYMVAHSLANTTTGDMSDVQFDWRQIKVATPDAEIGSQPRRMRARAADKRKNRNEGEGSKKGHLQALRAEKKRRKSTSSSCSEGGSRRKARSPRRITEIPFCDQYVPASKSVEVFAKQFHLNKLLNARDHTLDVRRANISVDDWEKIVQFADRLVNKLGGKLFMSSKTSHIRQLILRDHSELVKWLDNLQKRYDDSPESKPVQLLQLWLDWTVALAFDNAERGSENLYRPTFNWRTLSRQLKREIELAELNADGTRYYAYTKDELIKRIYNLERELMEKDQALEKSEARSRKRKARAELYAETLLEVRGSVVRKIGRAIPEEDDS
ncbi:hypothetical protein [Parendozoicomonas haliclonae]|uniref:Uncharacterized protein n=1 Tax=Parendozoicomonas haliclonae TaxID=1960125 RepID=A0A1X7AEM7_9GAMM|nr:hypothetical protein [Parendozoicomonas haliclonae]SMA35053.1 hypothetical protein EHSB41UT_00485 [Parendozoicomonas haliclonae]